MVIGAPYSSPNRKNGAGAVYVIYGNMTLPGTIDLASLKPSQGITIQGAVAGGRFGYSVGSAGDVNGDGFADVIGRAHIASVNGKTRSGAVYLIYGNTTLPETVDLASLTPLKNAFIQGAAKCSAGYIKGFSDVIMGFNHAAPKSRTNARSTYAAHGAADLIVDDQIGKSYVIYDSVASSPLSSPNSDESSASSNDIPWYSPAYWLKSFAGWFNAEETLDTTLPYVKELVNLRTKCQQLITEAPQISTDPWYTFSLEDIKEDINLMLHSSYSIQKDTLQDLNKRLKGIQKDFVYEEILQTKVTLPYQSHQLFDINNTVIALAPSLPVLPYHSFTPPALTQ